MNSTIKRVVLSVVLLQTACSQAFTEFTNASELAEKGQEVTNIVAQPGFMGRLASYVPSRASAFAYIPSKETVLSYVPSTEVVTSRIPSKDAVLAYVPSKETVLSYVPSKDAVLAYVPSKETVLSYATVKNGAIAAGTAAAVAGLYAGYKYRNKLSMPTAVTSKLSAVKAKLPAMPKIEIPNAGYNILVPNFKALVGKQAEDKAAVETSLKAQVLAELNNQNKAAALSLVDGNVQLASMINNYFAFVKQYEATNNKNQLTQAQATLQAIEMQLAKLA